MLSVVKLCVVLLSVHMPGVIMLSVVAPASYRKLDHEGVNDAPDDGDEVKGVPRVHEVALPFAGIRESKEKKNRRKIKVFAIGTRTLKLFTSAIRAVE
jgi:hypothetical protein